MMVHDSKSGETKAIDYREMAPASASRDTIPLLEAKRASCLGKGCHGLYPVHTSKYGEWIAVRLFRHSANGCRYPGVLIGNGLPLADPERRKSCHRGSSDCSSEAVRDESTPVAAWRRTDDLTLSSTMRDS